MGQQTQAPYIIVYLIDTIYFFLMQILIFVILKPSYVYMFVCSSLFSRLLAMVEQSQEQKLVTKLRRWLLTGTES